MTRPRPSRRESLTDYLSLRRALGFTLASAGRLLDGSLAGAVPLRMLADRFGLTGSLSRGWPGGSSSRCMIGGAGVQPVVVLPCGERRKPRPHAFVRPPATNSYLIPQGQPTPHLVSKHLILDMID
jgi:hypothetical protein